MFHHIAMFKFREGTPEEAIADIAQRLRVLPDTCSPIRSYRVGTNAGVSDAAWDLVVVGEFDDEAGWREYAAHPDHVPIVEDVKRLASASARLQTTDF